MERETCFICGTTISRGNRSEVSQQKMDKLVSVQRTVDHSSTIICDILSRILNETVMGEENVCRLCYNLLNDIDYHLKVSFKREGHNLIIFSYQEAQEKTDEITAKFLDKEKDPLRYNPQQKVADPRKSSSKKEKHKQPSTKIQSAGQVSRTIQTESLRARSPSHVPVKGGGKGQSFFKSPERMSEKGKSPRKKHSPNKNGEDSDDEMSEKKRKLLSRVLAPAKKSRHPSSGYELDEEKRLTIDIEEEMLRKLRKKEKKLKKREKRRRLQELEERLKENHEIKHENDDIDLDVDFVPDNDISDLDDNPEPEPVKPPAATGSSPYKQREKSEDIRTVDLSQLGDLFSEYPQSGSQSQVYAKKSIPPPGTTTHGNNTQHLQEQQHHQQQLQQQQQQQQQQHHQQQHQVYIVQPDTVQQAMTSITLQPGQEIPIIDCRTMINNGRIEASEFVVSENIATAVTPSAPTEVKDTIKTSASAAASKEEAKKGAPSVPCPHCPKLFMRGYNMRVHIERVHNKSKPWQCQFCEKTFATTSDLKQHLSSHGMGKIHKCEDCGREFSNRDSAILHRKQHNNERTHFCKDCGKGFFKASCLQVTFAATC